jgi:hypothetical protein
MAIFCSIALPRIKTTYSLPVETVAALDRLSARWGVSRSEALARAVAASEAAGPPTEALVALDALQRLAALDHESAEAWATAVRNERTARQLPPDQFSVRRKVGGDGR